MKTWIAATLGAHTWARFWKQDLVELLARSERP